MGVFYETIPDNLIEWILKQKIFYVATAPLSASAHINVSPKGGEYFGVIDERTFWYQELTGSGIETLAHLHEPGNGRITIMLNAFEGGPKIVRLWGKGRVLENGCPEFEKFVEEHGVKCIPGTRSIIIVDVHQVGSSCGFSVPFYEFKGFRTTLNDFFEKKDVKYKKGDEKESMDRYWAYKNAWSMDGMPGMKRGVKAGKEHKVAPMEKMVGPLAKVKYRHGGVPVEWVVLIAVMAFLLGTMVMMYAGKMLGTLKQHEGGLSRWNSSGFGIDSLPVIASLKR
jgi:hypothetical protein